MGKEIERKFLVTGNFRADVNASVHIRQGYLSSVPERIVRVRIRDNEGYITIKGPSDASGIARFEWERSIGAEDAAALLKLAEPGAIDKTRHLARNTDGVHTWEIDEFHGQNEGLIVAEIELSSADEDFDRPAWLGVEVTGDPRYYNSMLASRPYCTWPEYQ